MSQLVTDLRECQAQNQQLQEEKKHMEDQMLALQMTLDEYQGAADLPPAPPPPAPQPKPTRTQVCKIAILAEECIGQYCMVCQP